MTLYFYKIIFSFIYVKLYTFYNKVKKKRENIFIFKRNMLILIDTSKIAYFSRYFWTVPGKLIRYYKNLKNYVYMGKRKLNNINKLTSFQ